MASIRRPAVLVLCAFALAEGALIVAACSSDSVAVPDDGADASNEAGPDTSTTKDTGTDQPDAGREGGHCSGVTGSCDIVLQDCPSGEECVVESSGKTKCDKTQASQSRQKGQSCCPGAANQCLPGLTCVGNACTDGGPETGRCTPACCKGDNAACGISSPEGIAGACELGLVDDNGADLYTVCTYRPRCQPFGVEPCPAGGACEVEDKTGTSTCIQPNGKVLGNPCQFANDCVDGLACIGAADAGQCRLLCLTPNSVHPFDASVEQGGAYKGGCFAGTTCSKGIANVPAWLSYCTFPDGG